MVRKCPRCGNIVNDKDEKRCPRCFEILVKPLSCINCMGCKVEHCIRPKKKDR